MSASGAQWRGREYVGVLEFDAGELRNVAYALGLHDLGAQDMLTLADELDRLNGFEIDDETIS